MPEGELQIDPSMRKAVLPEPKAVVYAPDSPQGLAQKAQGTIDKYFNGANPLIMTKPEEEKAKQK